MSAPQPAWTGRQRGRRFRRAVAAAVPWLAGAWMGLIALDSLAGESPARQLAAVVLAAASGAVLRWRHANPGAVAIASLALAVPYHALVPDAVIPIPAMFALWAVTSARPPRISLLCLSGVVVVSSLNFVTGTVDDTMFTLALAVSVWALAEVVRSRRDAIAENARQAVRDERDRIARELHDVIAHSVTVMVVQAAAAGDVFDTRTAEARHALSSIEEVGRATLSELRRLLNVVRLEDGAPSAPQPGLARIDELAGVAHRAGLLVTASLEGTPVELPAGVDVSAYRIVQEALTNTMRHGNATHAYVTVRYGTNVVDIDVVDDGRGATDHPGDGHGRGLVGMRERAAVLGGTVETGPDDQGGYRVHARLPVNGANVHVADTSR